MKENDLKPGLKWILEQRDLLNELYCDGLTAEEAIVFIIKEKLEELEKIK